jgi:hypothetical protein
MAKIMGGNIKQATVPIINVSITLYPLKNLYSKYSSINHTASIASDTINEVNAITLM